MTVVRTYLNRMEAEMAKGAPSADIESMVQADDLGGMRPSLWMSGVSLSVRPEDAEKADKFLAQEFGSEEEPESDSNPEPKD